MTFEHWLKENGYDVEATNKPENAKQRKHLEAAWKAETAPPAPPPEDKPASPPATSFDETMRAIEVENERIEHIRTTTARAAQMHLGDPAKVKQLRELAESAITDKKMDAKSWDLALLRADRMIGPMVLTPRQQPVTSQVVEAALCRYSGLATTEIEKRYKPEVLEAADKSFGSSGLSLLGAIDMGARANGWRGHSVKSNLRGAMKAAWRENDDEMHASVGPSTYSIPSILQNVAQMHVRVAFEGVEDEWRKVALISSVTDYREISTVALTGDMTYKKVAKGGEVKHGTFGDIAYGNAATLYALLLGIDEQDLVNDSMKALTTMSRRLGRGGALTMNQVFWAEWLDDAAFFPTDGSLANYDAGATDSVLTAAGLTNMNAIFRAQTDPDGQKLGIRPKILLVPPALEGAALTLMGSEFASATNDTNIWRNRFEVVSSDYLTDPLAWYLIANPQDAPAIEMVFLNGQEMPQTEQADMAIDRLGIVIRGKHSFGARKQEYRAAVKAKGAA